MKIPIFQGVQINKKAWPTHWEKAGCGGAETACESNQILDLSKKYFKVAIINMFTELKGRKKKKEKVEGLN